MPIDPWIARGGVPMEVDNTLARIGALKQRDQMLQQDAQQNAFMQQRFGAQQAQDDEDDAEWDAAYAARDWGAMAKIDPQAAKAIYEFENKQPQAASLPGEIQRYEYGQKNPGFREYEDRNRPQPQPREPREPPQPTLRDVNLPDGTVQSQWLRPGESSGTPVGAPVKPNQDKPMSAKDANTARIKLTQVKVARRQLQDAQAKYAALKGSISAGPGGGLLPTPSGKAYDAAIDTMRSSISALTRVPGIGAMSDFETRLDQAKFPTRNNYESVGEQQLQALGDQLDTIESSYQEMLGGKAAQTTADPEPKVQKTEAPKAALDYLKANPNSKAAFFKKYGYLPK